jgi:hypothetical protein
MRFAAVQLQHDGAGTVADEHGYFELESATAWDRDTLLVLTDDVRSTHAVARGHSSGLQLAVRAAVARRRQPKTRTGAPRPAILRATWGIPGTQYAFLVKNDAPTHQRTLRTVSFYIGDGALPSDVFRVRLYVVAGNAPGPDLLTENVVLGAPQHNAWFTLDLARYQLKVPEVGLFVALEYFPDEGHLSQYQSHLLWNYTPTGPFMRPVWEASTSTVWSNPVGKGWVLLPVHNGLFGRYGAMIKLEVDPAK